jgi:hypothetical protein
MVVGKRRLDLVMGSSSPSSSASVVACSSGLPSKARGEVAPGGFGGTPYLVGGTERIQINVAMASYLAQWWSMEKSVHESTREVLL